MKLFLFREQYEISIFGSSSEPMNIGFIMLMINIMYDEKNKVINNLFE